MATFNAFDYCRKHGAGKSTIKAVTGEKVRIEGLPKTRTAKGLKDLARTAESVKVKFPDVVSENGSELGNSAQLVGEFAEGLIENLLATAAEAKILAARAAKEEAEEAAALKAALKADADARKADADAEAKVNGRGATVGAK